MRQPQSTSATYDGYIRVSVVGGREGERFQSPDAQRKAIQAWADFRSVQIADWFEDLDRSGGTLERRGLQAVLTRIEEGETGGIVVAKLDRLSRSVQDGLRVIELIEKLGGQVVSTADNIDTTTANGRLQLTFFLAIAEWYRNTAREQWADTQAFALARGALPGRHPYGTRRLPDGRVEIDPDQAAVVARMVAMRAGGRGWKAIATVFAKEGVPNPSGTADWAASTVQGIVSSESCLGVFKGAGHRIEDAWPPMVSRGEWDAAQAIRGKRDAERKFQDRLIAGIARCAGCRRTLKRTTNQQGHVSYGCTNRACPGRASIGANVLDTYVTDLLDERLRLFSAKASDSSDDEYDALLTSRDEATAEFERWRDDAAMRAIIGNDDYRAGLIVRAQRRDAANEALAAERQQTRSGIALDLPQDSTLTMENLGWEEKRQFVEVFFHAVFVRQSARRGPFAAKDVAVRTKIEWSDDRTLSKLPSPVSGPLPAMTW